MVVAGLMGGEMESFVQIAEVVLLMGLKGLSPTVSSSHGVFMMTLLTHCD